MNQPWRILLVEDVESDALLVVRLLERTGRKIEHRRVDSAEDMRAALRAQEWDAIISDYRMPGFEAPAALDILKESGLDLPFIVVSGTVGEDVAVGMMRQGAHDYLIKDSLARLAPAVEREISDAEGRRARKASDEALRASEALLESVVESAVDAVILMDDGGRAVVWNAAAERMFGYAASEALGRPLHDLVAPLRMHEAFHRGMQQFQRTGEGPVVGSTLELTATRRDGSEFPVELSVAPVRLPGTRQTVGVVRDISNRKRAEEALRQSEQRWQYALEGAGDGVWDLDVATNEVYVSPSWKQMLGLSGSGKVYRGLELRRLCHPADRGRAVRTVTGYLKGLTASYGVELRVRAGDGDYKWVLVRGKIMERTAEGKPLRMIGTMTDITERRRAEEEKEALRAQFLQAQKMESIGRLSGGIAHDFNNLLTVINGYSGLALRRKDLDPALGSALEEIAKAGERAAALVRQLLAFGRKQMLKREVLDLNELIGEMEQMIFRWTGDDVEVVTRLAPGAQRVVADRYQVEQVLMNLVVNARDAMTRGGTLTIETARESGQNGKQIRITVRDTGAGMSEEVQRHIFEPFFTTKEQGKGTGLGLSTVHGIVVQSGGRVAFESEPGKGTAFHVYLPATGAELDGDTKPPARPRAGTEMVLLVEDQPEVRGFVAHVLEEYGYRVKDAAGGAEALEILGHEAVDVLLADLVMPRMSGRELASRARAQKPDLKVMFMSGYSNDALANTEELAGWAAFIQKPFTPEHLAVQLRALLDTGRQSGRVLVVDDEPAVRDFLRAVLEEAGYTVAEADDGNRAVAAVKTFRPDLVITDLVMPEHEGMEAIQILKRDYPALAVIAMSGASGGAYLRLAERLGARAVLPKPFSADELRAEVRRVLQPR